MAAMTSVRLYAYEVDACSDMPIASAPTDRDWMEQSSQRFAYRCLPLTMANQAGWWIANPVDLTATWDGGPHPHHVRLEFGAIESMMPRPVGFSFIADCAHMFSGTPPHEGDSRITSHFGCGVVTFTLPYLFRTPPGVNLWVKGPSNHVKDGALALEGIVETDWLPFTFTMNWKLTRPGYRVRFSKGEPVCMVMPFPRGYLESFEPMQVPISSDPDLQAQYQRWSQSRTAFNEALRRKQPEAVRASWQREYMKGLTPGGRSQFPGHQTRLQLKEFTRLERLLAEDADDRDERPVHLPVQ